MLNKTWILICAFCTLGLTAYGQFTDPSEVIRLARIQLDIRAREKAYAMAYSEKKAATVAVFFTENAVAMWDDRPAVEGRTAIQQDLEAFFANDTSKIVLSFESSDVVSHGYRATVFGQCIGKDASGKIVYTGKYMAIWEKRNDQWMCFRIINNDDAK